MQNNLKFIRKLPIPMDLKEQFPLKAEYAAKKANRDREIADIFLIPVDAYKAWLVRQATEK